MEVSASFSVSITASVTASGRGPAPRLLPCNRIPSRPSNGRRAFHQPSRSSEREPVLHRKRGEAVVAMQDRTERAHRFRGAHRDGAPGASRPARASSTWGAGCGQTLLQPRRAGRPVRARAGCRTAAHARRARGSASRDRPRSRSRWQMRKRTRRTGSRRRPVFALRRLMFFDDLPAAFRNLRAAARSGGRLSFVCWQGTWRRTPGRPARWRP